ncbi:MAG: helix-turn-helix domain-containing protein [Actinomycetota bacterium]|nr:helix-turn-helix domain-containing protein [Actinomycetota bacterium]
MKEPLIPLYVRLAAEHARRLEEAVSTSGKSKRQVVEDAVREHLADSGLVGRITLPEPEPEILTAVEAAALLRVDDGELIAAAQRGELPGRQIGEEWRFSRAALLAWLGRDAPADATVT